VSMTLELHVSSKIVHGDTERDIFTRFGDFSKQCVGWTTIIQDKSVNALDYNGIVRPTTKSGGTI
jgi:hypothetical protein